MANTSDISAVYVEGRNRNAFAEISGNVSATSDGHVKGIERWGHSYGGNGEANVTVGGNVSAESSSSNAFGIKSDYASVNVSGDVTAKGKYAYGVESSCDNNLTVGGNVKSEGEISTGICMHIRTKNRNRCKRWHTFHRILRKRFTN